MVRFDRRILRAMAAACLAAASAQAQTALTVNTASDLVSALTTIDNNPTTAYTVNITGALSLGSSTLPAINTASTVTINGPSAGAVLDFGGATRGFLVYAGTVAFNGLTIQNAVALGGNGGAPSGGGGGGLGGGLFVAAGANVTVTSVSFLKNKGVGGAGSSSAGANGGQSGGAGGGIGSGGGGGLGGNGGQSPGANGSPTGGGGGVGTGAIGGTGGSGSSGGL